MSVRRISPVDSIEPADSSTRAALQRMLRWARRHRRQRALLYLGPIGGLLVFASLMSDRYDGMLAALLAVSGAIAAIVAGRLLLGAPKPLPTQVIRHRLRTRWLDRALAGHARSAAPDLTERARFMRDHVQPAIAPVRPMISRRTIGLHVLGVAVMLVSFSGHLGLLALANRQEAVAAKLQDPADAGPWVAAQAAGDGGLAARAGAEWLFRVGLAGALLGLCTAWAISLVMPMVVRRRILSRACPACGYNLAAIGDSLDPSLGAQGCGPAVCHECSAPWPLVAMATDAEILAASASRPTR